MLRTAICTAMVLALGWVAATPAVAQTTLKVAHNGPEDHPFQAGFEAFKQALESGTNGEIKVEIFPSEQLGDEETTSQMVKTGTIACSAASAGGGLAPFVPEADLLNLPFLFRDTDHFYKVVDGPTGEQIAAAVEESLNAKFVGWWFSGVRNAWNGEKPVTTPADLEGMKIRVMGSPVLIDTFNTLGAQATPMSFGEVYTSLQQGVIDGAETDHVDLKVEKFYEVTKYVSLTGHLYLAAGLICSNKVFDGLSEEQQKVFLEAAAASVTAEREAMATATDEARAFLEEQGLVFNDVDIDAFREKAQPVYAKNAERVGGMSAIEAVINQ